MRSAHPYEEIAYDLFPLAMDASFGLGRLGVLPQTMNLGALAQKVARVLHCAQLRICGDVDKPAQGGFCGGSGGRYVDLARRRGADVLITGDIDHHQALDAQQTGLALIDPGHYASEYPVLYKAEAHLRSNLPEIVITPLSRQHQPNALAELHILRGRGGLSVECLKDMWELQNTEIEMVKLASGMGPQLKELLARNKDDELACNPKA